MPKFHRISTHPAALDAVLDKVGIAYRDISREALFLAAKAHQAYRRRGGERSGVLPDFVISAHAAVLEALYLIEVR